MFNWDPKIVLFPVASNWTVIFWAIAIGLIVSKTVTITVAECEFPLWSWTVKVTLLLPVNEQLNVDWLNTILVILQLSELALSNIPPFIKAWPLADKYTVNLALGRATGAIGSNTTAVVDADLEFPLTSVAVTVIVFIPISEQEIVVGEMVKVGAPQLSALADVNWVVVGVTVPEAEIYNTTPLVAVIVGLIVSKTVTIAVFVPILPTKSDADKVTVFEPKLLQLNAVLSRVLETIPQLSVLPFSISFTTIEPFPLASK